jgi:hypothetical protein
VSTGSSWVERVARPIDRFRVAICIAQGPKSPEAARQCNRPYLPRGPFPARSTVHNIFRQFGRDGSGSASGKNFIWRCARRSTARPVRREKLPQWQRLPSRRTYSRKKQTQTFGMRRGRSGVNRYYLHRSVISFFRGCPANMSSGSNDLGSFGGTTPPPSFSRFHRQSASSRCRLPTPDTHKHRDPRRLAPRSQWRIVPALAGKAT